MDKLIDISRESGFPLCAETLQVLYDNARAVNVLLAGLNLPNKSAVILGTENLATAATGYRYMYVVFNKNRRLVRYTTATGVSMLDLSSAKVTITITTMDVHDNMGNTIEGVYKEERAVIENTNVEAEKWKFYKLKEVLEPAMYTDLLPEFRAQLANTNVSLAENYGNILCKNDRKLRVKLKLVRQSSANLHGMTLSFTVSLPGDIAGVYPLNALLYVHGEYHTFGAVLENGALKLNTSSVYNDIDPVTQWIVTNQTIIINSEVLL